MASSTLDPLVAKSIRAGLQSIRGKAILGALGNKTAGFKEASDKDYDSLRNAMREAKKFDDIPGKPPGAQ